jgi:hypothetical protein
MQGHGFKLRRIYLPSIPVNRVSSSGIIVSIRERRSAEMANQQRVPNLQELDEQQAYRFLTELFSNQSREEVYEVNHPDDYTMEMPQSGEAIRVRENMRRFQEAYPGGPPSLRLRRVLVRDGLWVVEALYERGGGQVFDMVMIMELKDGKIWRDRRYYAEPFEAPEWRTQWVERVEF